MAEEDYGRQRNSRPYDILLILKENVVLAVAANGEFLKRIVYLFQHLVRLVAVLDELQNEEEEVEDQEV